jgi:hypothetical protein
MPLSFLCEGKWQFMQSDQWIRLRKFDSTLAALTQWQRQWFDELRAQAASGLDRLYAGLRPSSGKEDDTNRVDFSSWLWRSRVLRRR